MEEATEIAEAVRRLLRGLCCCRHWTCRGALSLSTVVP
jgi:hypothetical protein